MGIRVLGTGSYTPAFQVTNEDMAKIVETNDEWIRTRTGIGTRHIFRRRADMVHGGRSC